ncbi:Os10g0345701, partial [Oryza sativa Japonica Group]
CGQISYLEEWSDVENNHSSSMSEAIKALEASTIRLPIVCGAKADAQGVKKVVSSALTKMDTMASSMWSLLSKVEGMSSMVFELAKVVSQEQMLLDQSRDLFSAVAVMHVKLCSLQACILQRN